MVEKNFWQNDYSKRVFNFNRIIISSVYPVEVKCLAPLENKTNRFSKFILFFNWAYFVENMLICRCKEFYG